jgi:hypothetical protein
LVHGLVFAPTNRNSPKVKKEENPAFPDLMQFLCDHVDGGQRNRLITAWG